MIFSSTVPTNVRAPVAIAEYLSRRFTYHSARDWINIIREGRVSINGKRCGEQDYARAGDTISYNPGEFEEPEANLSYSIIYEDEWILGVNKPANLLVHRAGRSFRNNLVYQLRCVNTPLYPACHPVHRLDRDTSGAVLVAKNSEIMGTFGKLFTSGEITKTYKALVGGCPDFATPFTIDAPIIADKNTSAPFKFKTDSGGKPASTVVKSIQRLNNGFSLLTVTPLTGRTHQIRVHLASAGFPIAGDKLYGGDNKLPHQALHCESLTFTHPYTGRPCEINVEFISPIVY